ncbi:hypothetical protein NC653_017239 [Populus alba x Populus x berolinensis]|uniref:Transmembrane protein n=1 Tax=Populus alba x Populus x berolinensis TaxID=444605 RepID=A0AAD6W0P8_9ROSI|nr:hypothetical protein NC653_017239 [Populus alba x Populus x berolinensis]
MFLSSRSPLWFLCVFAFSLLFFSVLVPPSILGAVAAEDGALKLLLLEATKTVVTLVVTLVYCSPWFSFCVSSAQDINDGDEDVSSASSLVKSMEVLLLSGFLEAEELLKMVKRWLKTDSVSPPLPGFVSSVFFFPPASSFLCNVPLGSALLSFLAFFLHLLCFLEKKQRNESLFLFLLPYPLFVMFFLLWFLSPLSMPSVHRASVLMQE